ncbi:extracellular solute-binding protein [Paenibacillus agaridevorans]|uniref:extracellular solute-binding protein n=1 Tax=Paenibacillus agaridevorans TaxID=171404 RepID=UPI001BE4B999|nr:extracellular solute-binding protein [Paenibacillus agaridevorans]
MTNIFAKKRMITFASLALSISLVFVSACSNGNNSNSGNGGALEASSSAVSPSSSPASVEANPFEKYEPAIEITTVRSTSARFKFLDGESLDNNAWTKAYENELGIKVKNVWTTDEAQYQNKMNVTIASGDLPDLMFVSPAQFQQLLESDQIEDLTTAYDQYASPFLRKIMEQDANGLMKKAATVDGKMMGITGFGSIEQGTPVIWLRTDWLEQADLPEPTSFDDILNIAEAFKKNHSGAYGIGLNKDLFGGLATIEGIANAYHAYPKIWLKDDSGKLVYGSVQPEMKQTLATLQDMYKRGLIDKEFGVKDGNKIAEDIMNNKIGLIYANFWHPLWPLQEAMNMNAADGMTWKPYPVLSADDQVASPSTTIPVTGYYVIKKGYKHPEAAIKLANLQLKNAWSDEAQAELYNTDKDQTPFYLYPTISMEPPSKNLEAGIAVTEAYRAKDFSKLNEEQKGYYDNVLAYLDNNDIKSFGNALIFGPGGSEMEVLKKYVEENRMKIGEFYGAPVPTQQMKQATLDKLELETFTKIIVGESPVDEFDSFVEKWHKLGGDEITNEINEWNAAQ